MRSNNPVLKNLPQADQQGYGYQSPQVADAERPMTIDDVVSKTGITLAVIAVSYTHLTLPTKA